MFLKIPFQVALKQYQKNQQKINPTTRFIFNALSFLLLKRTKQRKQSTLLVPYKHRNLQSHAFLQTYNAILPTSLTSFALVTRGYSPWRPAAVISTILLERTSLICVFRKHCLFAPSCKRRQTIVLTKGNNSFVAMWYCSA